jgi:hypothetical protein
LKKTSISRSFAIILEFSTWNMETSLQKLASEVPVLRGMVLFSGAGRYKTGLDVTTIIDPTNHHLLTFGMGTVELNLAAE